MSEGNCNTWYPSIIVSIQTVFGVSGKIWNYDFTSFLASVPQSICQITMEIHKSACGGNRTLVVWVLSRLFIDTRYI